MPKKIVTRFAPSPTGFLHVGGLRTALYNYLFAKKNKGDFLLRLEDTDQQRKVKDADKKLIESLKIFGLNWDNKKIVYQSKRLKDYKKAAETLIKTGQAYYCFCSKQRLDDLRASQVQKGLPPSYDRRCYNLTNDEIQKIKDSKKQYVIRFKMPKTGQTGFTDLVRGQVNFDNKTLDDQIIIKSDGFPTYHLASVIDDHQMKITHVIRGEEWLPSTPKHILLYQAFGWEPPQFAHLPLLLNSDKSKLSKRQGDVAVEDYLAKGYLPQALLNFILLLGWNPGTDQEIFDLKEMIKAFSLEKVNKSGAIFNTQKLDWLNSHYVKQKSPQELAKLCQPYFNKAGIKAGLSYLEKVVVTEQARIKHLDEIVAVTEFFFKDPAYKAGDLVWKKSNKQDTAKYLKALSQELEKTADKNWNTKDLEKNVKNFIAKQSWGMGDVLWPLRFALSGRQASPGPFEIASALGQKETLKRIGKAINLLG